MSVDRAPTWRDPLPIVDVGLDGTVVTARVGGDVDVGFAVVVGATIENAVEHEDVSRVVVDLDQTKTFGASGIAFLARLDELCEDRRIQLVVTNPSILCGKYSGCSGSIGF